MSFSSPSFMAGGTIAPSIFVKVDVTAGAANDHQVVACGAGGRCIGISQEGMKRPPGLPGSDITIAAETGNTLRVYGLTEECLLTLGGTVTHGDFLKSDASGNGVAASTGDLYGAMAEESGVSGQKVRVQVVFGTR